MLVPDALIRNLRVPGSLSLPLEVNRAYRDGFGEDHVIVRINDGRAFADDVFDADGWDVWTGRRRTERCQGDLFEEVEMPPVRNCSALGCSAQTSARYPDGWALGSICSATSGQLAIVLCPVHSGELLSGLMGAKAGGAQ